MTLVRNPSTDPRRGDIFKSSGRRPNTVYIEDVGVDHIYYRLHRTGPVHAWERKWWSRDFHPDASQILYLAPDSPNAATLTAEPEGLRKEAQRILREKYPNEICIEANFEHLSYPLNFGNTAGPFGKPGQIVGHAFTTWQIDLFCQPEGHSVFFANGRYWRTLDGIKVDLKIVEPGL